MSRLLFPVLVCIISLMAVACAVFGMFVRGGERPYLNWAVLGVWLALCLALGWVMWAGIS
jgi:hypothetical protein